MATTATNSIRARRESIVNAHIEAEAVNHDVSATVATFRHPRYEVPALGAIVVGAEGVNTLVSGILSAFPDFYLHKIALHHADDAVVVEARFGGTQRGTWAGIDPTGKRMEVQGVLIFVFEGDDLVCEKVYFDHATVLRQLGCSLDHQHLNGRLCALVRSEASKCRIRRHAGEVVHDWR